MSFGVNFGLCSGFCNCDKQFGFIWVCFLEEDELPTIGQGLDTD